MKSSFSIDLINVVPEHNQLTFVRERRFICNNSVKKIIGIPFLLFVISVSSSLFAQNNFVKQQDTRLMIGNKPYHFVGANMWYANLLGMTDQDGGNRKRLLKELDFLKAQGITNIRVLIGAQGEGKLVNGVMPVHPAVQTDPASYNEAVMEGMDFLLQQLQKRKMYGVFYFSNNWEWSGGFLQYLNWRNKISDADLAKKLPWEEYQAIGSLFYSCQVCKEDYWGFIEYVLQRTNKLSQKKYIDEEAVMAWEIANEPRPMKPVAIDAYREFLRQTSALIKKTDPHHLLTIGAEGYMGTESIGVFEEVHTDKNIDYATIHIWPKNWSWFKDSSFIIDFPAVVTKTADYIRLHEVVMVKIKKPLVIEEFGLPRDGFSFLPGSSTRFRDQYFESVLKILVQSKKDNSVTVGINFWAFGGFGKPAKNATAFWKEGDDLLGDPPMEEQGLNSVFASDRTTWKLIKNYAKGLKN